MLVVPQYITCLLQLLSLKLDYKVLFLIVQIVHYVCVFLTDLGSAVAMLAGVGRIQGVVRFLQLSEQRCLIDGTIDGLEPGPHGLHVHTLGDLTQDCLR